MSLGTDGFGRSDNREHLRRFFEVDAESIAAAALARLARDGKFDPVRAAAAIPALGINPEKSDPCPHLISFRLNLCQAGQVSNCPSLVTEIHLDLGPP